MSLAAVYRGFDAAALDREYDARASVASFAAEYARYVAASEAAARFRTLADVVFDEASGERLDFYSAGTGAPVFLWVHGGYWRALSKADNAFVAPGLLAHGVSVAVMDYTLAPAATLDEIVRQVRAAVGFLLRDGVFGVGAGPIGVGGHSAGGQLVGMLLARGWHEAHGGRIGTALSVSGLHEMEPMRFTHQNAWLRLDEAAAARNSPALLVPAASGTRLLTAVGGDETAEFRRQAADYAAAWRAAGHAGAELAMPGFNHFDVALSLGDPAGTLAQAVAASMLGNAGRQS